MILLETSLKLTKSVMIEGSHFMSNSCLCSIIINYMPFSKNDYSWQMDDE